MWGKAISHANMQNERNEMKRIMVVAAALFAAMFVFSQDGEIVKVRGKGTGTDKTEALKDAYRDAVERAVGLYVDTEQMMKNEELVKDQILTQSNAYIEKYDIVKENTKPNGLVEVQILAEVRKTALTKKISDVMPSKTFRLGGDLQNVHAKMNTSERRNADGAALLKKALEGFNPLMLVADCSLASPEAVIREKGSPNTLSVNYLFRSGVNQQHFFEKVVPRLKDVLAQISLSEPREITIPFRLGEAIDVVAMVEKRKRCPNYSGDYKSLTVSTPRLSFEAPKSADTAEYFGLVVGGNKYMTVYSGIVYELDAAAKSVVDDWQRRHFKKKPIFNVSMLDASGEIVVNRKILPWVHGHSPLAHRSWTDQKNRKTGRVIETTILAPWGVGMGGRNAAVWFEECAWQEFLIPKDVLPAIKDMKIEIAK